MGEDYIPYGNRGMTIDPKVLDRAIKDLPKIPELSKLDILEKMDIEKPIHLYNDGDVLSFTLDEAIDELYQHPIDSNNFKNIQQAIQGCLRDSKYDEYLIVFKSKMHRLYHPSTRSTKIGLNDVTGIKQANVDSSIVNYVDLFHDDLTFMEDKRFEIKKRRELEYNPIYKQLVVAGYITDGRDIILLRTKDNANTRIKGKYTFIQGHVDFSSDCYILNQNEYLKKSLEREFNEEISADGLLKYLIKSLKPKFFINDNTNFIGLEHFGIIYEWRVEHATDVAKLLSTNEHDKHEVVVVSLNDYSKYIDEMDSWVPLVLKKVEKSR